MSLRLPALRIFIAAWVLICFGAPMSSAQIATGQPPVFGQNAGGAQGVFGDGGFVCGGGGEDYSAGDGGVADGREFAAADG